MAPPGERQLFSLTRNKKLLSYAFLLPDFIRNIMENQINCKNVILSFKDMFDASAASAILPQNAFQMT